jgi:hypothetical protein
MLFLHYKFGSQYIVEKLLKVTVNTNNPTHPSTYEPAQWSYYLTGNCITCKPQQPTAFIIEALCITLYCNPFSLVLSTKSVWVVALKINHSIHRYLWIEYPLVSLPLFCRIQFVFNYFHLILHHCIHDWMTYIQ